MSATLGYKDDDLTTFRRATGATDLNVIASLTKYLKEQSLWPYCRFASFKSTQNYPTGNTVKMLGGWTANDIALFGSVANPTTAGRAFDATDDRGTWDATDMRDLSEVYHFDVQIPVNASVANACNFGECGMGDAATLRNFYFHTFTSAVSNETTGMQGSNGVAAYGRSYTTLATWSAGQKTQLVCRASSSPAIWQSKTSRALDAASNACPMSSMGWTTDHVLNINCDKNGAVYRGFIATTRVALLFCKTALTQTQRETITDYLDQF